MTTQSQHCIHKQAGTEFGFPLCFWRWLPKQKIPIEEGLGECSKISVVPGKVHVQKVDNEFWVGCDLGPGSQWVCLLRPWVGGGSSGQSVHLIFGRVCVDIEFEVPPTTLTDPLSNRNSPSFPDNSFSNLGTTVSPGSVIAVSSSSSSSKALFLAMIDSATSSKLSHVLICLTRSVTSCSG